MKHRNAMRKHLGNWLIPCLLGMVIAGILFFGLQPKGYRPANNLRWVADGPGIVLDRFSIAHTDVVDLSSLHDKGFSVAISIRPTPAAQQRGFLVLMMVHGGDDARQFVIGQWRGTIIAMNGDDYNARRKIKRITADLKNHEGTVFVVLTSEDSTGSKLYIDGVLQRHEPALRLVWPTGADGARLVVGNSVYGRHPWQGVLSGLAVFDRVLYKEAVEEGFTQWQRKKLLAFDEVDGLAMHYPLTEGQGNIAHDHTGNGHDIILPQRMRTLKKTVLAPPWQVWWEKGKAHLFLLDTTLNLAGFIPLGFLMAAYLARQPWRPKKYWLWAACFCFLTSLTIELSQIWIPSRYSHMLDLLLNSSGGGVGVGVYVWVDRRWGFMW